MLTTDALKKLYVAMGGTASDVENLSLTPELIDAIAEIYSGGGSSLPAVTSDDNGKALRVASGEWAVDANKFVVEFVFDDEGNAWFASKTFAQIKSAISAGKEVVGQIANAIGEGSIGYGQLIAESASVVIFNGTGISISDDPMTLLSFSAYVMADDSAVVVSGTSSITIAQ